MANPDYSGRRRAIAAISGRVLPVEMRESPALSQADQLLANGYGLVVAIRHFSKGDFFRVLDLLFRSSPEIGKRPVLIPIAEHQRHFPGLAWTASFTNIQLQTIVTPDTKEREALKLAEGKKIPWQAGLSVGTGVLGYIRAATKVLCEGGVVVSAPEAGRRSVLSPFKDEPFEALERGLRRKKNPEAKVAYLFAGIEIPGVKDYEKHFGYNLLRKYLVTFGEEAITREAFLARVRENGLTIDELAYQIMLSLEQQSNRPSSILLP